MGKTTIEWTDCSWNPIVGCTEISPGCANCYAARLAATRLKKTPQYQGLAVLNSKLVGPRWTGEVRFLPERLEEPLHWRRLPNGRARRIFVCDMGDLFHESVQNKWLDAIFAVMAVARWNTFQVLTKRAACMHQYLTDPDTQRRVFEAQMAGYAEMQRREAAIKHLREEWHVGMELPDKLEINAKKGWFLQPEWPLPNVWAGTSVENQHFADERIPLLLSTPAAVRWISAEPLLGPVDLNYVGKVGSRKSAVWCGGPNAPQRPLLNWVVCGGESGPGARPMHPDWARSLRDQCQAAGVPFFFKQWGSLVQSERTGLFVRIPKKIAGRLLDCLEWNEFPQQVTP